MKVCIFGAGAIGGHLAARLAKSGAEVSVVARGPHLAAMQANGLTVHAPDGDMHAKVNASADAAAIGPQDLVVVTVKAPSLASVAEGIGPLLGPNTAVAFLMNGMPWWYFHKHGGPMDGTRLPLLDPGDGLWNKVGPERVIGGIINSSCEVIAPGVVKVVNHPPRISIGEPDGTISPRAEAFAAALTAGGCEVEVIPTIRDAVWDKLLGNLSGGISVLTQAYMKDYHAIPILSDTALKMAYEAQAIALALGRTLKSDPEKTVAYAAKLLHKGSITIDLELGRPMEVDAIYTVPLQMARELGVATPWLDVISAMVKLRAQVAGSYPK